MMQPATPDPGFKGCAHHSMSHPILQSPQQRPRIPIHCWTTNLPAQPLLPQHWLMLERLIQGDWTDLSQLLQPGTIIDR
jgi:hypothetical protein